MCYHSNHGYHTQLSHSVRPDIRYQTIWPIFSNPVPIHIFAGLFEIIQIFFKNTYIVLIGVSSVILCTAILRKGIVNAEAVNSTKHDRKYF